MTNLKKARQLIAVLLFGAPLSMVFQNCAPSKLAADEVPLSRDVASILPAADAVPSTGRLVAAASGAQVDPSETTILLHALDAIFVQSFGYQTPPAILTRFTDHLTSGRSVNELTLLLHDTRGWIILAFERYGARQPKQAEMTALLMMRLDSRSEEAMIAKVLELTESCEDASCLPAGYAGLFSIGGDGGYVEGQTYYSNGVNAFCRIYSRTEFELIPEPRVVTPVQRRPRLANHGDCHPMPFRAGTFQVQGQPAIYKSNGSSGYCVYASWNDFEDDGRLADQVRQVGHLPRGMKNNGVCQVPRAACELNGQQIAHRTSITAWKQATVSYNGSCLSETRTCMNGTLSGTFTQASCKAVAPKSCVFLGKKVEHGQSVRAFKTSLKNQKGLCESQQRHCVNGELSGTFTHSLCK